MAMARSRIFVCCASVACGFVVSCAGASASESTESESEQQSVAVAELGEASDGIRAHLVDNVWILRYGEPENPLLSNGFGSALYTGVMAIANDCLVIGEAVVVWPENRVREAAAFVDAIQSGVQQEVQLGGGGRSTREGDSIPAIARERCGAEIVWFANP